MGVRSWPDLAGPARVRARPLSSGLYRDGLVTPEEWTSYRLNLEWILENDFYQHFWSENRQVFTSEFRDEVKAIFAALSD